MELFLKLNGFYIEILYEYNIPWLFGKVLPYNMEQIRPEEGDIKEEKDRATVKPCAFRLHICFINERERERDGRDNRFSAHTISQYY